MLVALVYISLTFTIDGFQFARENTYDVIITVIDATQCLIFVEKIVEIYFMISFFYLIFFIPLSCVFVNQLAVLPFWLNGKGQTRYVFLCQR